MAGGPLDLARVRVEYEAETGRLISRRLVLTALLFLLFVGAASYAEWVLHPERCQALELIYGLEVAAFATGLLLVKLPAFQRHIPSTAAASGASLAFLLSAYHIVVGRPAGTLAIALVCLMTGFSVLLPWGARPQLAVCVAAIVSFTFAWLSSDGTAEPYPWIAVFTGATTSVWGAYFLDHYRYEAFVRTAEVAAASNVTREEAEISKALAHVGATLSAGMGRRDMFESVNRLAVDLLGCDWSTFFVFDDERRAFRFCSNLGSRPEVATELAQIDFPLDSLPLFGAFRRGEIVVVPDAAKSPLVPPELGQRWDVSSALYIPIWRADRLGGVLASGYSTRRGPFPVRLQRLALGLADAAAIALENERLVADLQAANRLKSEFVSTMSHELRTPLNVITGYTEMLDDLELGALSPQQRDLVHRIDRNAESLLELINSTLDLGRLEAGRDELALEPLDLRALLSRLCEELEPLALDNDVALSWSLDSGHEAARSDRGKLKTIVKNLVGNAIKFAPGGRVEVTATIDGETLSIAVRDDGIGIAPENVPTIFEMFRQLGSDSSTTTRGVGLGLHISKRLAERLGGSIAVDSKAGFGSTFTLRVPISPAPHLAQRSA